VTPSDQADGIWLTGSATWVPAGDTGDGDRPLAVG
jgi:hypothetical protein